ncbi:hypothetical protein IR083_01060 [Dysgonomonas sp. GY75]|nr:hypothetical protein [Dysgonomonas sp. GY75]MBF0647405.1 hypothetical protein [Dysgonomonas sp. GY75]
MKTKSVSNEFFRLSSLSVTFAHSAADRIAHDCGIFSLTCRLWVAGSWI